MGKYGDRKEPMKSRMRRRMHTTGWDWCVLSLVGMSVTYLWLSILIYHPQHQLQPDGVRLDLLLEEPQQPLEVRSEELTLVEQPLPDALPSASEPAGEVPASMPVSEDPVMTEQRSAEEPTLVAPPAPEPPVLAAQPKAVSHVLAPTPPPVKKAAPPVIRPKLPPPVLVATQKISPPQHEQASPMLRTALHSTPVIPAPQTIAPTSLNSEPVPVSRLTRTPTFVHKELPNDPEDVLIPPGGVRVIARITLDETAAVRNVQIDKSGEPAFDVAVISAIRRSRFTPGYIGDHPVATVFNQTYRFQLQ